MWHNDEKRIDKPFKTPTYNITMNLKKAGTETQIAIPRQDSYNITQLFLREFDHLCYPKCKHLTIH